MKKEPRNGASEIQARKTEIAATRERVASGVEELKDRVSPENVARAARKKIGDVVQGAGQAVADGMKQVASDTKDAAMGAAVRVRDEGRELTGDVGTGMRRAAHGFGRAIRDNPVPSALTALGIAYLVYEAASETDEGASGEGTRGARVDEDNDATQGMLDEAVHRAREGATDLADRAIEGSQHAAHLARRGGRRATRSVRVAFVRQPLLFGLGAFALGLAIGAMVPSTERENQLLGEQRDRLLREATTRAKDAGEVAKEAARKAVRHVDGELPLGDERPSVGKSV